MKALKVMTFALVLIWANDIQAQNALDFDGIDDYAIVPSASSMIANSNQISLAFWVYPTNPAPSYPNYDGFVGFRDNSYADFYILQLTATNVEVRFRNSSGISYDIVYNGLVLNTWQHFAMTYDGSTLKLYHNGQYKQSIAATGLITSTTTALYIGDQIWGTTHYYLDGMLDEIALWKKALSATEVTDIYTCGVPQATTELKLYYSCDQGVANGNNAGITTLVDNQSSMNGALYGFALAGTSSNWVNGVITAPSYPMSATICNGDSFLFAGQYYKTAGTYSHIYQTSGPCDSMVVLTLTIKPSYLFPAYADVCQDDSLLWLGQYYSTSGIYTKSYVSTFGCDSSFELNLTVNPRPSNFSISGPSTGLIGQTYTYTVPSDSSVFYFWNIVGGQILSQPSNNSAQVRWLSYGWCDLHVVALDNKGCRSDTMLLEVNVGHTGLSDMNPLEMISIHPNPVYDGRLWVEYILDAPIRYIILDTRGKTIMEGIIDHGGDIDISQLKPGIYLMRVTNDGVASVFRVITL